MGDVMVGRYGNGISVRGVTERGLAWALREIGGLYWFGALAILSAPCQAYVEERATEAGLVVEYHVDRATVTGRD